jgi:hypothetical protein
MRDKSLGIFLMVLFGAGGITILVAAWTLMMSLFERIVTIGFGLFGLLWAFILSRATQNRPPGDGSKPAILSRRFRE